MLDAECVHHGQCVVDVLGDLVVVVRSAGEPVADHVERDRSVALPVRPEVAGEGLPVRTGAVQHHNRRRLGGPDST